MSPRIVERRRPHVLVVDDVPANRELLGHHLGNLDYEVEEAADGAEALERVEAREPDLILLDIAMPHVDGLTVCRRLKADPRHRLIPIVLLTANEDRATRLAGIEAGADEFLTKPFDPKELFVRTKVLLRDRMLNLRLDGSDSVILTLARIVEARDLYTVHHAERVGLYSRSIGKACGLDDEEDLDALYRGGVLHDLGKAVIPRRILRKPGPLTEEEWLVMHTHSVAGERICQPLRSTTAYLPLIRHHHERFDGRGYPDHLTGAAIPIGARIAAVADGWDAMVTDRPYRSGLTVESARAELTKGAGTQWDAELVAVFTQLLDRGEIGDLAARASQVAS